MKRAAMPQRSKPMSRGAGFKTQAASVAPEPKPRKRMKSKGLARTKAEKEYHNRLAGLGCIACMIDHEYQPEVSIHHVAGRTKPGCHMLVLPLCAGHHQAGTGNNKSLIAVHPDKARFEARYGTQVELMARCAEILKVIR